MFRYSNDPKVQDVLQRCCEGTAWRGKLIAAELATLRDQIKLAERQRDELLGALKRILPQYEALLRDCGLASEHTTDQARAAIAKVTEESK